MPQTQKADWSALPLGELLTITEAAAVIGISLKSLYCHYTARTADCNLPDGIRAVRNKNGRTQFLCRTKEL